MVGWNRERQYCPADGVADPRTDCVGNGACHWRSTGKTAPPTSFSSTLQAHIVFSKGSSSFAALAHVPCCSLVLHLEQPATALRVGASQIPPTPLPLQPTPFAASACNSRAMSSAEGAAHVLELLSQPLDCAFHGSDNLLASATVEGDVTIFDFRKEDAGEWGGPTAARAVLERPLAPPAHVSAMMPTVSSTLVPPKARWMSSGPTATSLSVPSRSWGRGTSCRGRSVAGSL